MNTETFSKIVEQSSTRALKEFDIILRIFIFNTNKKTEYKSYKNLMCFSLVSSFNYYREGEKMIQVLKSKGLIKLAFLIHVSNCHFQDGSLDLQL